jgi:tagatose 6-phosphate kinase
LIYCTLLNPSIDVCYSLDRLDVGGTHLDIPSKVYPSGKGLNVAATVKALGEEVMVTGVIPADDKSRFVKHLDSLGIGHALYEVPGCSRISVTLSERGRGQVTHITAEGRQLSPRIQDEVHEFIRSRLRPEDICALSGSLPRGFDPGAYANLIRDCRQHGVTTLIDSRGEALKLGVRANPTMIKPNLVELEGFFGEQIKGVRHIALKGKRLLDSGISYVFISLGADGLIAIHDDDCLLCSVPAVEVIDTVGCGDALAAGIIVGHVRKFSFHETCRMAVAAATSKALHLGPGFIDRDEVCRLMEEVVIQAV